MAAEQRGQIGVRDAIDQGRHFLQAVSDEPLANLRLEEIEYDDAEETWLVTLGYDRVVDNPLAPLGVLTKNSVRVYKIVTIDAFSGKPRAMRIRTL